MNFAVRLPNQLRGVDLVMWSLSYVSNDLIYEFNGLAALWIRRKTSGCSKSRESRKYVHHEAMACCPFSEWKSSPKSGFNKITNGYPHNDTINMETICALTRLFLDADLMTASRLTNR